MSELSYDDQMKICNTTDYWNILRNILIGHIWEWLSKTGGQWKLSLVFILLANCKTV